MNNVSISQSISQYLDEIMNTYINFSFLHGEIVNELKSQEIS